MEIKNEMWAPEYETYANKLISFVNVSVNVLSTTLSLHLRPRQRQWCRWKSNSYTYNEVRALKIIQIVYKATQNFIKCNYNDSNRLDQ